MPHPRSLLRWSPVLSVLPVLFAWSPAAAQALPGRGFEEPVYTVTRITSPIVLDGRVDEAAWEAIAPLPAAMHMPDFGAPPTERTEFRIAHDGEFLYASCRNYDSDIRGIQATSLRRDDRGPINDNCSLYVDTFNDGESAAGFMTTPSGIRTDVAYANDGEISNFDWDSFWDAAVSRDEHGWYAEIRVPFSSLLFQTDADGRVQMGLAFRRTIARKGEMATHPAMPAGYARGWGRPSNMRKIVLEGVERVEPVYVTPYTLAGGGYTHALSVADGRYLRGNERVGEVGFDLRFGIRSNATLDLTVNTDFAQVEADDQQVNLTRFSLFFPEKRRFFQERGAIFEYPLGGQERLFHSRRVGLAEGQPVRIYGGGRATGRVGEWDFGLLNMQTAESELLPSENLGVVRLRRRVMNANSYAGGIVTTRLGREGHRNVVYGFDGIFRLQERDFLTLNWAQSFDAGEPAELGTGPLDRSLVRANLSRRGEDGFVYGLEAARVGEIFEPGMGFLRRRDYTLGSASFGYGWRPGSRGRLISYAVGLSGTGYRRNESGAWETAEVVPNVSAQTSGRHNWTLTLPLQYEQLARPFALPGGQMVPAGDHRFVSARLNYRAPDGDLLRPHFAVEAGQFYDGRHASFSFSPLWSPSMYFGLGGGYGLDHVEFADRGQSFTSHVARVRAELMFTASTSVVTFVQYNSTLDAAVANVRLRFNPREGNDFYIVWNEGLVTDRYAFDPVRPLSTERTLLVKYAHTLRIPL